MKTKCVSKFFISSVLTSVSEISVFMTKYIHKCTIKTIVSYNSSHHIGVNSQK